MLRVSGCGFSWRAIGSPVAASYDRDSGLAAAAAYQRDKAASGREVQEVIAPPVHVRRAAPEYQELPCPEGRLPTGRCLESAVLGTVCLVRGGARHIFNARCLELRRQGRIYDVF